MKKILFLSLIIMAMTISCTKQENKFPIGAWHWVSAKVYSGGSLVWDFPGQYIGSGIKIWGEKCVNDIGRFQHDTTVINLYNSATYKLDGNRYFETIKYHWVQGVEGQTVKCLLELRNDTLIQTNNVDEAGKVDKNNYGVYKFVRMK